MVDVGLLNLLFGLDKRPPGAPIKLIGVVLIREHLGRRVLGARGFGVTFGSVG